MSDFGKHALDLVLTTLAYGDLDRRSTVRYSPRCDLVSLTLAYETATGGLTGSVIERDAVPQHLQVAVIQLAVHQAT